MKDEIKLDSQYYRALCISYSTIVQVDSELIPRLILIPSWRQSLKAKSDDKIEGNF